MKLLLLEVLLLMMMMVFLLLLLLLLLQRKPHFLLIECARVCWLYHHRLALSVSSSRCAPPYPRAGTTQPFLLNPLPNHIVSVRSSAHRQQLMQQRGSP
jgi:hypothetical protein